MTHRLLTVSLNVLLMALAGLGLSACLATWSYYPARVSLCEHEGGTAWEGGRTQLRLSRDDVDYSLYLSDLGSENANRFGHDGRYWVQLTGLTVGRDAGWRAPAMSYDPAEAFIEIDGKRVTAVPKMWEAKQVDGYYRPVKEVSIPVNLNVVGTPVIDQFFVAFDMADPLPLQRSTYRLGLGSISLDGVKTALPVFHSCYTPGEGRWYPVR